MTELRDLLERAAGPAPSDVASLVGDDLARGRRALRRRTAARAVAGVAVVGTLALAVPRVLPALDGGGDVGPAGQGPAISVTEGQPPERPVAEVYEGVEAALAERGLAVPPHTNGSPLRWSAGSGPMWLGPASGPGVPQTHLFSGSGLSGSTGEQDSGVGPQGLMLLRVLLQRLDEQPSLERDYCDLFDGDAAGAEGDGSHTCEQRDVDAGTVVVSELQDEWLQRHVVVGLFREDATAVSVSATVTDDFSTDVLVDLAQDPRLRW